jgi:nicotinic acid mononucleotide adenylyltransferase
MAVTGGGTQAIPQLFARAGASRLMLEANVPYHAAALRSWVGGTVENACSETTALQMAVSAYERARRWLTSEEPTPGQLPLGLGATAALATTRQRRGADRAFVALHKPDATLSLSIDLGVSQFGEDSDLLRRRQEQLATNLILSALLQWNVEIGTPTDFVPSESIAGLDVRRREQTAEPPVAALAQGALRAVFDDGREVAEGPVARNRIVFPGSFNPLHEGHRQMARIAAERFSDRFDGAVLFELSISNADKSPLDFLTIDDRISGLRGAEVDFVLTRAPRFDTKAELFPDSIFIVGADTAVRIGAPRFYEAGTSGRDAAIEKIAAAGCRFLVFGRARGETFLAADALDLPPALRDLCIAETTFRNDVSSTAIRREGESRD